MSSRRKVREIVLQAVYAYQLGDHTPEHVLQTIIHPELQNDPAGLSFAESLFLRSMDHREQAEDLIRKHISNWEIDRLAIVDRIILQIAISELISFDDIPTKVTINEAIEIAKKYSTAQSGRFVNGILDVAMASLFESKLMKKSGRGLIDQTEQKPRKSS
ncbi:MAG: transcription antitermination factor NusB [Balneolales bacterium]